MQQRLKGTFLAILCLFVLGSCAGLREGFSSFGAIFRGNTKKDIDDYSLEEKAEYRRYKTYKKLKKEDDDEAKIEAAESHKVKKARRTKRKS
ncbi:MAG: hypothetical protein H7A33_06690 [Deltaproteobacteria bacterium]|nr:hypothetical protein [Deltaproteobacteria bacterium]